MFDYGKLRGRIVEKYKTGAAFATAVGLTPGQLSARLNNTTPFRVEEIKHAANLLDIKPEELGVYFFTEKVQES